jgi:hypothetical protein
LIGPEIVALRLARICTVGDVIVIDAGVITMLLDPHVSVIRLADVIVIGPPTVVICAAPTEMVCVAPMVVLCAMPYVSVTFIATMTV